MKYKLIICALLVSFSCQTHKNDKKVNIDGFYLQILLESYYSQYYQYPKDLDSFMMFIKDYEFPDEYSKTINTFKRERKNIFIENNDSMLIIKHKEDTVFTSNLRSPCDELNYNIAYYLNNYLLFNRQYESVINDSLVVELQNGLKNIQCNYNKVLEDNNPESFINYQIIILTYDLDNGLNSFCSNNKVLGYYPYFGEVENYLFEFMNNNNMGKIILPSAIFYN